VCNKYGDRKDYAGKGKDGHPQEEREDVGGSGLLCGGGRLGEIFLPAVKEESERDKCDAPYCPDGPYHRGEECRVVRREFRQSLSPSRCGESRLGLEATRCCILRSRQVVGHDCNSSSRRFLCGSVG